MTLEEAERDYQVAQALTDLAHRFWLATSDEAIVERCIVPLVVRLVRWIWGTPS